MWARCEALEVSTAARVHINTTRYLEHASLRCQRGQNVRAGVNELVHHIVGMRNAFTFLDRTVNNH